MIAVQAEAERAQLVLSLRQNGISDQAVLTALERVPREYFIPDTFKPHAYDDSALPIGQGQTISQPLVVAMMTQALEVTRRSKVLEIGTGSGYQAAILSLLARRVYTVERHKTLLREAESLFKHFDLHNIVTQFGDGALGWPGQAPFDRIMVTAAAETIPEALIEQLGPDGRMVIPIGRQGGDQRLFLLCRTAQGITQEDLGGVRFVPLLPDVEGGP